MKTRNIFYLVLITLLISCNSNEKKMIAYTGFTQGTTFSIKFFTNSNDDGSKLKQGIDSIYRHINYTASTYDENSIISKVNRNEDVELNEDFIKIFNKSIEVSESTDGCFDITVGDLVRRWGFGFKTQKMPTAFQVDSLRKFVGYKNLSIIDGKVVKKFPEIKIDFNAIAQGYTVDLVAEYLFRNGCANFIVEIGGEVRANGTKENNIPWIVGIEKPAPNDSSAQTIQHKISLFNKAISTSGNYRKFFIKDGIKYSHTIDPKTGYPVHHSLLSVSIIADDCTTADAYCTVFMVMGIERAKEYIKLHPSIDAYFIYSDSLNTNQVFYTPKFFEKHHI